ncbi:hypothetical protein M569_08367 [Genlisea aurea]|uniref:Uncharacterized protein n=1 Tax=Genlisea aurea TaxID=192259 RepID=S8CNQ8_9LAMI|nr:hypothetical protein M569_08367 [Genlisea aurea]
MEFGSAVVERLKDVAKSTRKLADNLLRDSAGRNPIEILKRLQREAFSDIMKLRERQEMVEKLLSYYKSSKGGGQHPFHEAGTRVKGKVDVLGALFVMDDVDEHKYDAIQRSSIRTGIDARLCFETHIREKDALVAEFIANEKGRGDALGGPLSLSKVLYSLHISDWLSGIAIPIGAQYSDTISDRDSSQDRGLTDYSGFGPPFLHQYSGSAIGIRASKSNLVASLAQFVSGLGMQVNSAGICTGIAHTFSTFGEISWRPSRSTKLSVLGVNRQSKPSGQNINLGAFAFPVTLFKNATAAAHPSAGEDSWERSVSDGSVAVMISTELDEAAKIRGWVEVRNSSPTRYSKWAVTVRDDPENEFGWGLTAAGDGSEHFQIESFVNVNLGGKFQLQPAVVYVKDGSTQFPAVMLRSSWKL